MAIYDLPEDILRQIYVYRSRQKSPDDERIKLWRDLLLLLSVCRSWRHALTGLVYSTAVFDSKKMSVWSFDDSSINTGESSISTNLDLITRCGFQQLVGCLRIYSLDQDDSVSTLQCISDALFGSQSECVEPTILETLSAMRLDNEPDVFEEEEDDDDDGHDLPAAVRDVVAAVRQHLPNIRVFDLDICSDDVMSSFLDGLVGAYAEQLLKVYCESVGYCPILHPATQLQHLELDLTGQHELYAYPIRPGVLKSLRITFIYSIFEWYCLRADAALKTVRFDHLASLSIATKVKSEVLERYVDFEFEFPRLTDLSLSHVGITPKLARCFMAAPLQRLTFEGSLLEAIYLCEHLSDSLEYFSFRYNREHRYISDDEVVLQVYRLLPCMRGPTTIECYLYALDCPIELSGLDISHITHLQLFADINFCTLVDKMPSMKNMISLDIMVINFNKRRANSAIAKLINMRQCYAAPLSSKIKILLLKFRGSYKIGSEFTTALGELSWWLPELEILSVV